VRSVFNFYIMSPGSPDHQRSKRLNRILTFYNKAKPSSSPLDRIGVPLYTMARVFAYYTGDIGTAAARAAACLAWGAALRLGELLADRRSSDRHLKWNQVHLIYNGGSRVCGMRINLGLHKGGSPATIIVPANHSIDLTTFMATSYPWCPISAFLHFVQARCPATPLSIVARRIPDSADPVFVSDSRGTPLLKAAVIGLLRSNSTATDAPRIKGHSLRIGSITTLARCGVESTVIRSFGRWKLAVTADTYVTSHREGLADIPHQLSERVVRHQPSLALAAALHQTTLLPSTPATAT